MSGLADMGLKIMRDVNVKVDRANAFLKHVNREREKLNAEKKSLKAEKEALGVMGKKFTNMRLRVLKCVDDNDFDPKIVRIIEEALNA